MVLKKPRLISHTSFPGNYDICPFPSSHKAENTVVPDISYPLGQWVKLLQHHLKHLSWVKIFSLQCSRRHSLIFNSVLLWKAYRDTSSAFLIINFSTDSEISSSSHIHQLSVVYWNFWAFLYHWMWKGWIRDIGSIQILYHYCHGSLPALNQHHSLSNHQHVSPVSLATTSLLQHLAKKHKHALFPILNTWSGSCHMPVSGSFNFT